MDSDNRLAALTAGQRQAFLDLVVLAMYVDGNLASVEDLRIQRLLDGMGFGTKYDRDREFDAAVTRVRPYAETPALARRHAADLAGRFGTTEQRQFAAGALEDFMKCDTEITPEEGQLLHIVKEIFSK